MYYRIKEPSLDRVVELDPEEIEGLTKREARLLAVDRYLEEMAEAYGALRGLPVRELLALIEAEGETYEEVAP